VKKNKLHIAFTVLLLSIILIGRVGLHVFHHHEFAAEYKSIAGLSLSTVDNEAADCALCKLDTFQVIAIEATALFVFFLTVTKPNFYFYLSEAEQLLFFKNSRGPPASFLFS
jgi:hypothetical protein